MLDDIAKAAIEPVVEVARDAASNVIGDALERESLAPADTSGGTRVVRFGPRCVLLVTLLTLGVIVLASLVALGMDGVGRWLFVVPLSALGVIGLYASVAVLSFRCVFDPAGVRVLRRRPFSRPIEFPWSHVERVTRASAWWPGYLLQVRRVGCVHVSVLLKGHVDLLAAIRKRSGRTVVGGPERP